MHMGLLGIDYCDCGHGESGCNHRMRLLPLKILVGLSVSVPIVGNPDLLGILLVLL